MVQFITWTRPLPGLIGFDNSVSLSHFVSATIHAILFTFVALASSVDLGSFEHQVSLITFIHFFRRRCLSNE